jgi:hypothetical protein
MLGERVDPRYLKFHFGSFGWCRLEIPPEDEV